MSIFNAWFHARTLVTAFFKDCGAIAATEFAMIVPIMLVLFFGTVEITNGLTVYNKVTLMAHTVADLTSQSVSVQSSDLSNFFAASTGIMNPYSTTPVSQTVTEIYIHPTTLDAVVQWSVGSAPLSTGAVVTVPTGLATGGSYVIYGQASYLYTPAVGYVMSKSGVTLSDFAYTRPRLSACVLYNGQTSCPTN